MFLLNKSINVFKKQQQKQLNDPKHLNGSIYSGIFMHYKQCIVGYSI